MTKTVKRFIAGAVCPRCSEMDKITMFEEDGTQFRECVACGFKDQQGGLEESSELETRVNQSPQEAKVEPVIFFRASDNTDDR